MCSGPPSLRIGRIVIDTPRRLQGQSPRDAVRAAVQERLEHDRHTLFVPNDRNAPYVLQVRIGEPDPEDNDDDNDEIHDRPHRVSLPVQVRLHPMGPGLQYEATARGNGNEPVAAILAAFDEIWRLFLQERQLDLEPDAGLIARLTDGDQRIRDFVIIRLGDRKSREAVLPLCQHLTQEAAPELVLRTVGSLVAIGDPRAIEPLIELVRHREPEYVLQLVYAIGAIGGRTAEAYLVTVASGHPVESIRQGAEQALADMKLTATRRAAPGER